MDKDYLLSNYLYQNFVIPENINQLRSSSDSVVKLDNNKIKSPEDDAITSCVNERKECSKNKEILENLTIKYNKLEKSYFLLEQTFTLKNNQADNTVKAKRELLSKINKNLDLYEKYDLNEFRTIKQLSELESIIIEVLIKVSKYKEKVVEEQIEQNKKKGKKLCVICMENQILILIKPCCHMCLCQICSFKVDSCPICRKLISMKEKINMSN